MAHYDFIQITFKRVKLAAFLHRTSFFNYYAAHADSVRSLWVAPVLTMRTEADGRVLQINGTYDGDELPLLKYGHPRGDDQLRSSLARFLGVLLPVKLTASQIGIDHGAPKDEGLLPWLGKQSFIDQMDRLSSHDWINLSTRRGISRIMLDEQEIINQTGLSARMKG